MSFLETRKHEIQSAGKPVDSGCADNPAAFEFIYLRYSQLVFRICLRILRDPVQAEDAAQDVFVCLLRKIHTFRGEAAFSSWLYRVTTNLVLMRLRKRDRNWISLTDFTEDGCALGHNFKDRGFGTNDLSDRIDLQKAIDLLPKGRRSVLLLHDVEGYDHKEIAKLQGYSVGNSKSQLHKARRRLRTLLQEISTSRKPTQSSC